MYSINFPKMFTSSKTLLLEDHAATLSNLKLLLASDRGGLFGDPYYGTILKRFIFDQNDLIVKDLIIDAIYSAIITFMPQISIERNNITITSDETDVYASIYCINIIDYETDMYNINLTSSDSVL